MSIRRKPDAAPKATTHTQEGGAKVAAAIFGALGVAAITLALSSQIEAIKDRIPFLHHKGGESAKAPKGQVRYKSQEAVTTSTRYLVEIGRGEATIMTKAKQDYDKSGGIFSGDFVPTNATASVSDPNNHDLPAPIKVTMRYCADGTRETTAHKNDMGEVGPTEKIKFNVGQIMICGADFDATNPANQAAFNQDGAPRKFKGDFEAFVIGAINTTAAAAPCPRQELSRYTDEAFAETARKNLATTSGLPPQNIEIVNGTIGTSSTETQRQLVGELGSYANKQNPKNPNKSYPALDIDFGMVPGAVVDSCYQDVGSQPLPVINGQGK